MVARFVQLKLTLLANALRRSTWQTVGFVLGVMNVLALVALAVIGAIVGGIADAALTSTIVILVGAVLVVVWWVGPLVAFGVDATLDPQRFIGYPIPLRRLMAGLAAAGLVSIPGAATALAVAGVSLAWLRAPWVILAALIGAALALASCIVGSRATTTALAPLFERRRYREMLALVALVPLMLFGPAIGWFSTRLADGEGDMTAETVRDAVGQLAKVAAWTPFGAPWAIPRDVYDGAWLAAGAHLAIAVATVGGLWWIWARALAKALVTPRVRDRARAKGLGWFARGPATPMWAITARCLTYWVRDSRYAASLVVVPLLPVVFLAVGRSGAPEACLILGPLTGFVIGFSISADLAYDHTAFALHVAAGVRGRDDRWGRALAVGPPAALVTAGFVVVSAAASGRWDALPALAGMSLGMMAGALGVASVVSARFLYPVPKPGESPFKQQQGAAMATMVAQGAAMGLTLAVALPAVGLGVAAIVARSATLGWVTLVVGLAMGVAALVWGTRWGARIYDRRAPELLQEMMSRA